MQICDTGAELMRPRQLTWRCGDQVGGEEPAVGRQIALQEARLPHEPEGSHPANLQAPSARTLIQQG